MSLFGRSAECRQLDALLDRAILGEAGTLLIEGEPGVGKTALLEYACDAAAARAIRVPTHRALEAEASLPFARLLDRLRPLLPALNVLPDPRTTVLAGY